MADDNAFVPEPQRDWELRDFLPQPGIAEDLGRGPWVLAGTGGALIGVGALSGAIVTALTSANPADVVMVLIIIGVALVVGAMITVGARLAARRSHRLSIPYPVNLPVGDRPRLEQLAVEYAAFHDQLEAVADPAVQRTVANSLTVPIGRRPFFLPEWMRRRGLQPGEDSLRIVTSRAWHDPWLTDHRLDIDPLDEATEIYHYLNQLTSKVNELIGKADAYRGTRAEQTYRQYVADLTDDLSAVRGRAEALAGYGNQIERLSALLQAEDALPQIETDGDAVRDLMAESRRHELATEHLQRQSQELRSIESGLREIRSLLADDQTIQLRGRPKQL